MQIVIEIPDSDITKEQEIITVPIHFIDGIVCEAGGLGFAVLPKGHGRLIDADKLVKQYNIGESTKYGNKNAKQQAHSYSTMMLYEIADMIDDAPTIIEADKTESEYKRCKDECKKEAEDKGLVMSYEKCKLCEYLYVCPYMMAEMNDIVEGN